MAEPDQAAAVGGRRETLAWKYLQGHTLSELAAAESVTPAEIEAEIYDIVRRVITEWNRISVSCFEHCMARLVLLEREIWTQWERSKQPRVKTTCKEVRDAKGVRTETTTITEEGRGDPRYLSLILKSLTYRNSLEKLAPASKPPPAHTPSEAHAHLMEVIQQAKQRQAAIDARQRQAADIEQTVARK